MWIRYCLVLLFLTYVGSGPLTASPQINEEAPLFSGIDSNGNKVNLEDLRGKPIVLEWTNHQCPYVRKHYESGNMQRLQRQLTEEGAVWISIISSAPGKQGHVNAAQANELTAMRGSYTDMVILDPSGEIGRAYNAKTTPQLFLIDEMGTLKYMGAIDDRPSTRRSSLKGANNYLLTAWASFKEGVTIGTPVTKPYGCTVKYSSIEGYK